MPKLDGQESWLGQTMEEFYTVSQSGKHTIVEFLTPSLMNPLDLENIGNGLFKLVDQDKRDHLVLDFTKVKYLSSQAIGIILTLNKMLNASSASGTHLVLCGVGPQLMQLLKITRLDRILTIKPTQTEAMGA
jgi:anti-anti-sigma factor